MLRSRLTKLAGANLLNKSRVKLLVADWSGTFADPYSKAPIDAFYGTFAEKNVFLDKREIRGSMGKRKKEHCCEIMSDPKYFKNKPTAAEVDTMYRSYVKKQLTILNNRVYTEPIKAVPETMNFIKAKYGMKIATTSGFVRAMHPPLLQHMAKSGFVPDMTVASDEVVRSRPHPDGIQKIMAAFDVTDGSHVMKIGDTTADIEEGKSVDGCITVGIARYNNWFGMKFEDPSVIDTLEVTKPEEFEKYMKGARAYLWKAKPDFVIDDITELPGLIDYVNTMNFIKGSVGDVASDVKTKVMDELNKNLKLWDIVYRKY